uniref:Uncharacterized protein n=1 Tax=Lactuca sativa TaxID=4236 RepID=A0A9R1X1W6_LACSA|nr:hypothetical protein LSAT_V11C800418600 [Lactuca sativa]
MSNTRSCHLLDDLPLEILSPIFVVLGAKSTKYIVSARLQTTCIDMFEGMGPKNLKADLFIRTCGLHNNIEVMFRQGIVYNYLMPILAGQFRLMGSTRVLLIVPKSYCGLLMLFIELQRMTSHSNVNTHIILLKGHLR